MAVQYFLLPPTPAELDAYLSHFTKTYNLKKIAVPKRTISVFCAHHRFAWIHPFIDGNGRVGRLHTDLMLKATGLQGIGIWCLSRGLARNSELYKSSLARADFPRQGDRDGRGSLSETNLIKFCEFMFQTAIDQVEYMSKILDPCGMSERISSYINHRNSGLIPGMSKIKPEATRILERAFLMGELPKRNIEQISGLGLPVTRKLLQQMKLEGLLTEESSRSPLRWAIPEHAERYYFPDLAPN